MPSYITTLAASTTPARTTVHLRGILPAYDVDPLKRRIPYERPFVHRCLHHELFRYVVIRFFLSQVYLFVTIPRATLESRNTVRVFSVRIVKRNRSCIALTSAPDTVLEKKGARLRNTKPATDSISMCTILGLAC